MTSSSSLYGTVTTQNASSTNSTSLYGGADTPIPDSSGNLVVRGDLYVLSGNILTTATTGNIFPANATTINLGLAATAVNIGAGSGTTTINNNLTVDGALSVGDATFGNITIAVADDNTISTTTGDLKLTSATDNLDLAAGTTFTYPEGGNRLNRVSIQSTTGNTSGLRIAAPNTTTSANSNLSVNDSSDPDNAQFLAIAARGSALTYPLRVLSGKYTAGVLGATNEKISFVDGSTLYATLNPAGPTDALDLTTVQYVNGLSGTTYTINASSTTGGANFNLVGSDSTTDTIKFNSGAGVTVSRTDANTIDVAIGQSVATTDNPTFAGATLGAITVGVATDNTITTSSGDLNLQSATNNLNLAQGTTFTYSENNDRLNRPSIQSTTGNTSGLRITAPNATTSAIAQVSAFSTNDNDNGKFISIQGRNAASNALRIQTGEFVAGVQQAVGEPVTFVDYTTVYATVNPAGPSASTDLVTVAYLTAGSFVFSQVNIDNRVYLDSTQLVTSATTPLQTLDSFPAATYRSAKYQISVSSGSDVQVMEVLVMHNGTTAYQTTYADMFSAASLTDIAVTISGSDVLLQVTPVNAVTTYKISRQLIVV